MSVLCNININDTMSCTEQYCKCSLISGSYQCGYLIDVDSVKINLKLSLIETEPPNKYMIHMIISM